MLKQIALVFVLSIVLCTGLAKANISVAGVFGDHMVLQQQRPIPVWGKAGADEEVTVKLADMEKRCRAGADGKWMVSLESLKAGGSYMMTAAGFERATANWTDLRLRALMGNSSGARPRLTTTVL